MTTEAPERDAGGRWLPGWRGGPGRPKGKGREGALMVLDRIAGKAENVVKLEEALQEEFDKAPVRFFERFVMPLIPRAAMINLDTEAPLVKVIQGIDVNRL